jgi:hypothetical protein
VKKSPPLPTVTVTVTALATVGQNTISGAIITTNTLTRSEDVFMTSISHRTIANNPLPPARR